MREMVRTFRNPGFLKKDTDQAKASSVILATGHPGIAWVGKVEQIPSLVPGTSRQRKGLQFQTSLQKQDRHKGHPGALRLRDTMYPQDILLLRSF